MIPQIKLPKPWLSGVAEKLGIGPGASFILLLLPVMVFSAITNIAGMQPSFGLPLAVLFGLGLQVVIMMYGHALVSAKDSGHRRRLLFGWAITGLISVVFSYSAMDAFYERIMAKQAAPTLARDALLKDVQALDAGIAEAKTHALQHLTNLLDYADSRIARAEARITTGDYERSTEGEIAIEAIRTQRRTWEEQKKAWEDLKLDAAAVMGQKDMAKAYQMLTDAHTRLANLWTSLRFGMKADVGDFKLPPPPAPPVLEAEATKKRDTDPILGPLQRLFHPTPAQFFWLFLALVLEAIPLMVAWAGAAGGAGTAGDHGIGSNSVQRMEQLDARLRPPYLVGQDHRAWSRVDGKVEPALEAMRSSTVAALDNVPLKEMSEAALERVSLFTEFCARVGIDPATDQAALAGVWKLFREEMDLAGRRAAADTYRRRVDFAAQMAQFFKQHEDQLRAFDPEFTEEQRKQLMELLR